MTAREAPVAAAPPPAAPPILAVPPAFAGPDPGPRRIDDFGRSLHGAVPQGPYEDRVRGAVARAQNLQGPLDGGWIVADAAGVGLFRFQIVDPGFAAIEGVWSDLRAAGPDAGGFFTDAARSGGTVSLQFERPRLGATTLTLQPRAGGGYDGEMTVGQSRTTVVMRRP